jgi:hypothetical protein
LRHPGTGPLPGYNPGSSLVDDVMLNILANFAQFERGTEKEGPR